MAFPELRFEIVNFSVNLDEPLIYLWEITSKDSEVIYRYIGKSDRGAKRPLREYPRNVRNLLSGRPYRKNNRRGYRKIHCQLANALYIGNKITLKFLCNIPKGVSSYALERQLQRKYDC